MKRPVPPYQQLAAALRRQIREGALLPGETLPSATALAEQYEVSRATASRAVQLLKAEGRVTTGRGGGVFVAERPPAP